MPATALRCRVCETEVALEAVGVCPKCFAPLEPVYDRDELARTATRERIAAGPQLPLALCAAAPRRPARGASARARAHPARPRAAACRGSRRRPALAQARHGEPDPFLQGPRRGGRLREGAGARLGTLACSSTGNLANAVAARAAAEGLEAAVFCPADLEPEKLVATAVYGATVYAVDGTYDDCSRLTVELSFELPWAFVNVGLRTYYAEGSKTLAYEIAEQLGWRAPTASSRRSPRARSSPRLHRGFADFARRSGSSPAIRRGCRRQAEGCSPVATAFAEERSVVPVRPKRVARSLAIGSPADGDLAARHRARLGRRHPRGRRRGGRRANMSLLAESTRASSARPPQA